MRAAQTDRASSAGTAQISASTGPRIRGDGTYSHQIVGESHYKAHFERLLGTDAYTEEERTCDALLRLDDANAHDPQAVMVLIDGGTVGYLSRADAREFRGALKRDGLGKWRELSVGARVYCGGEEGIFSVELDLPQA